jgi:indole-3-glycerol phosphate synthase
MSDFVEALRAADVPVIMELKRRSAAGDDLFGGRPVAEIVAAYEELGAPCISVVTGRWFGGDEQLLREAAALTDRPILMKDFVIKETAVARAKAAGASAVLLTAELLPSAMLGRLIRACIRLDVTPFVEITNVLELADVVEPDACVVAVNNKDIRVRERGVADIDRSLALLPRLLDAGVGCAVSASGIATPGVAARLLDAGFDGLLVGTGLLTAPDPEKWRAALTKKRFLTAQRVPL